MGIFNYSWRGFCIICTLWLYTDCHEAYCQMLKPYHSRVAFYSEKEMNFLEAFSERAHVKLDTVQRSVQCKVLVSSFQFTNCSRMVEKIFNDLYMESNRYHWITFKGQWSADQTIFSKLSDTLEINGTLTIKGVSKPITLPLWYHITESGTYTAKANTYLALKDFGIYLLNEDEERLNTSVKIEVVSHFNLNKK